MRFVNSIKLILSGVLILSVAACAPVETRRSTGAYIDDAMLTAKVKAALVADPELKATEINVDTYKGTVQLSGFVASPEHIPKAAALARKVDGVHSVRNDIASKR